MALSKIPADLITGGLSVDPAAPADAITVTSGGNVGVGTSSPSTLFDVRGEVSVAYNATYGLRFYNQDRNNWSSIGCTVASGTPSANLVFKDATGTVATMTGGNLLVGTTTAYGRTTSAKNSGYCFATNSIANGAEHMLFTNNGATTGSITRVGGTGVAYNTSSDYRLKENVVGVTGASARVQQLNPVRFNFIADPAKTVDGFLAHEVQDVVPEAITGAKDAVDAEGNPVYQGIDQSKLVPLLTAALQEALTKIETLEARVAALEAA